MSITADEARKNTLEYENQISTQAKVWLEEKLNEINADIARLSSRSAYRTVEIKTGNLPSKLFAEKVYIHAKAYFESLHFRTNYEPLLSRIEISW